jgi:hypothetical protein
MTEESENRTYRWVLPLTVGIFCGGLGGSVFTWYMNRPKPTILTYRIATTTLSAPEAVGLIPNLKVLIGGSPIQALYAYNVELLPRQGPFADQADVAFSFSSPVRIYGIHQESPSDLHHLECSGLSASSKTIVPLPDSTKEISSVECTMRPILFQGSDTHPFRITMATDKSEAPHVFIVAKNLDLVPADDFSPKDQDKFSWSAVFLVVALMTVITSLFDVMRPYLIKYFFKTKS